jgi:AraC-like DNA-binding protein
LPAFEKIQIAKNESFKGQMFYKIVVLSIGLSTITYNLWALKLIRKRHRSLLLNFSKIEDIDLNWLRILTIASLSVFALNHVLFNLNLIFEYSSHKILSLVSYSFASVYVLFLGFFGLKQKNVFITVPYAAELKKAEKQIPKEESAFIENFLMFMKNERPFLDPELNISKLSKLLSVKTEYLSEILNTHLHQTFFDFINKYRIEEFKKQYSDEKNKNFSIVGIAYNCGFNSKASFYRAFKKFEKTTPSGYLRKVS